MPESINLAPQLLYNYGEEEAIELAAARTPHNFVFISLRDSNGFILQQTRQSRLWAWLFSMANSHSKPVLVAIQILVDEIEIRIWSLLFWRLSSVTYHEQILVRAGRWVARPAPNYSALRKRQQTLYAIVDRMYQLRPTLTGWSPYFMSLLSTRMSQRFEDTGETHNIDEAIHLYQRAMELAPISRWAPPRKSILWSLVQQRFEEHNLPEGFEEVTSNEYRNPRLNAHQYDPLQLCNVGNLLSDRLDRTGSIEDLNRAIELYDEAYQAIPDYKERAIPANNFARLLITQHE